MKFIKYLMFIFPLMCFASMDLRTAYKHIPEIADDQQKVVPIIWDMPQTNIQVFVKEVKKAFKSYPTSESNRTNMYAKLDYWVGEATNNHPTVELLLPWASQLPQQVNLQMLNNERNKTYPANGINPGTPIYDFDVITLPSENVPVDKAWINGGWKKAKKDLESYNKVYNPCWCNPYKGQSLK